MMLGWSNALKLKYILIILVALFVPVGIVEGARNNYSRPVGPINDFASIISPDEKADMERLALQMWLKTRTAVVVATFETIGRNDPDTYANRVYKNWGIGIKGEDKGVLIILVLDRGLVGIETGSGMEEILPPHVVGRILDD